MSTSKKSKIEKSSYSLIKYLNNRYALTFLVFCIYIAFFDHYSLIKQQQLRQTLIQLQEEKSFYLETIEKTQQLRLTIQADEEKFARERYYMKEPNQDVLIIE